MGLHESLLDVPERLRIWQLAGVRYFFLDAESQTISASDNADSAVQAQAAPAPIPATDTPQHQEISDDSRSWPSPWPKLFAKSPANPFLVITYAALGSDMTGRADPRHGSLWRKLLAASGLAGKNAVAFWPMSLPESADAKRDTEIFLAGLHRLRPRILAVFDPDFAASLPALLPADSSLSVLALPHPTTLLRGDKEVWDNVVATLAAAP